MSDVAVFSVYFPLWLSSVVVVVVSDVAVFSVYFPPCVLLSTAWMVGSFFGVSFPGAVGVPVIGEGGVGLGAGVVWKSPRASATADATSGA